MQRREFLNTSVLSALGCSILPGSIIAQPSVISNTKIQNLLNTLEFRKESFFTADRSLALCEDYLDQWLNLGYSPLDSALFWSIENYAVIPVQIDHPHLGIIESCFLNFHKSPDGQWDYCGSMSGYHIEAIHKALEEIDFLNKGAKYARHLFLPVPSSESSSKSDSYCTFLGSFELIARISIKDTVVRVRIIEDKTSLWEKEYHSNHLREGAIESLFA